MYHFQDAFFILKNLPFQFRLTTRISLRLFQNERIFFVSAKTPASLPGLIEFLLLLLPQHGINRTIPLQVPANDFQGLVSTAVRITLRKIIYDGIFCYNPYIYNWH